MDCEPLATCEPITQAARYHLDLATDARWNLSVVIRTKAAGVRVQARYVNDRIAARFCRTHGLTFPPVAAVLDDAPMSCAHDPDHGCNVDRQTLAAGDQP